MPGSKKENTSIGGPVTRGWLASIGVHDLNDVRRIGSIEIYRILKHAGKPVSLNLVYGLEGAILGVPWNKLPSEVKMELRRAVKELR